MILFQSEVSKSKFIWISTFHPNLNVNNIFIRLWFFFFIFFLNTLQFQRIALYGLLHCKLHLCIVTCVLLVILVVDWQLYSSNFIFIRFLQFVYSCNLSILEICLFLQFVYSCNLSILAICLFQQFVYSCNFIYSFNFDIFLQF